MPTVLLKGGVSLCLHDANWASGWKELHSFSFVSWSLCWHPSSSECPHGHCWMPNHIQFVWQFHNAILCFLCSAAAGKVVRWGIDNRYRDLMPVRSNSSNWKQSFSIHRWQGLVKLNCQVLAEQNVSLSPVRTCCTWAFLACPCAWLVRLNHTYIQLTMFKN